MISKILNTEEEFLAYWVPYFQKVADLQFLLFSQLPDIDVNDFITQIPEYFFQTKTQLIELFASIYSLHFSRISHRNFCIKLFEILIPSFFKFLSKDEFGSMLESQSKDLCLLFYKLGAITFDQILYNVKQFENPYDFLYFHDIIQEHSKAEYDELRSKYSNIFDNADLRDFQNRRRIGKNDFPLALSIREDDIENCQIIISSSNINFDSRIPYSLYETLEAINQIEDMPSLLEYAAFFGSIKCFKYFIMNNSPPTEKLISYAIFGGNIEIIHICEMLHAPLELALRSSICCFRDDFFEYFQDSQNVKFNDSAVCCSIRNYNVNSIIHNLHRIYQDPNICDDRGDYLILIASAKNYIDVLNMLISSKNIDLNVCDQDGNTSIHLSVENHHKLIYKILIEKSEVDINKVNQYGENLLTKIVENNCIDLLHFALSRNDIIILNSKCRKNEIIYAICHKNLEIVKFFFNHEKYKDKVKQMDFYKYFVISAAFIEEWEIVDYLLSYCQCYPLLMKYIELLIPHFDLKSDICKKLKSKIYEFSLKK